MTFLFGADVFKDDFCFGANGHVIRRDYQHNMCSEGCPLKWLNDGTCHRVCNTTMCKFDDGDCLKAGAKVNTAIDDKSDAPSGTWSKSMSYYNGIYNDMYGFDKRWTIAHAPYFLDKEVMKELARTLKPHFARTSKNKFRDNHDIMLSFTYYYFIIGEKSLRPIDRYFQEIDKDQNGEVSLEDLSSAGLTTGKELEQSLQQCHLDIYRMPKTAPRDCSPLKEVLLRFEPLSRYNWKYQSSGKATDLKFIFVHSNPKQTMSELKKWNQNRTKFLCLNDATSHDEASNNQEAAIALTQFLNGIFPDKSSLER